jgi:hypothetical protein
MRSFPNLVLLVAVTALLLAAGPAVAGRTAGRLGAAAADALDVPLSLAANADGDVYVGFVSDLQDGAVRRFSPDGAVLAYWEVGRGTDHYINVAQSGEGGVYVSLNDADLVRHYDRDGLQPTEWPVAGLRGGIATAARDGGAETEVYVIATAAGGGREVRRYGPGGDLRATFPVAKASYDLTVWPTGQTDEASFFVAEYARALDGPSFVSRYRSDGTKIGEWEAGGTVAGMDADVAGKQLWVGESYPFWMTRHLQAYGRDGTPGTRCELPVYPTDLTVGQNGDLYVLVEYVPDALAHPPEIRRYRQDCTLVDTWNLERLNGFPPSHITSIAPTMTPTPTVSPFDSATPTTVKPIVTPTAPPSATDSEPTTAAAPSATPTYFHTSCPGPWYLPAVWRNHALGGG